jgi:hypothetical protein
MARLVALVAVVALAATPAAALAQENPFLPQQPQQQAPPDPVAPVAPAPPSTSGGGDGFSSGAALLVGAIVVALIGGIWIAIARDARASAPRRQRRHSARVNPDADDRRTPGAAGRHRSKPPRHRKPSRAERKRRKRGRAR